MLNSYNELVDLIKLLNEKAKLLTEILSITDIQTKAIEDGKLEKLDNLIQVKQGYIDKINNIDKSFNNHFKAIKKKYNIDQISELHEFDVERETLVKIEEVTQEVYGLLTKTFEIEKRNSELINTNFHEVKSRLKNIKQGKKVTSNYYKQPNQTGGYFIDKGK